MDSIYWRDQIRSWLPFVPALLVGVGFYAGLLGSVLGLGGGWLMFPALSLLALPAEYAVATSLTVVLATSTISAWQYYRRGLLDLRMTGAVALPAALGSFFGHEILSFLAALKVAERWLGMTYAVLLPLLAWVMITSGHINRKAVLERGEELPGRGFRVGVGLLGGLISGLLGIGGGIILVPALTRMTRLPLTTVVATSLVAVSCAAITGTFLGFTDGVIEWHCAAWLASGSIFGSLLGGRLAKSAPERLVRGLFAAVALVTALSMCLLLAGRPVEGRLSLFPCAAVLGTVGLAGLLAAAWRHQHVRY